MKVESVIQSIPWVAVAVCAGICGKAYSLKRDAEAELLRAQPKTYIVRCWPAPPVGRDILSRLENINSLLGPPAFTLRTSTTHGLSLQHEEKLLCFTERGDDAKGVSP